MRILLLLSLAACFAAGVVYARRDIDASTYRVPEDLSRALRDVNRYDREIAELEAEQQRDPSRITQRKIRREQKRRASDVEDLVEEAIDAVDDARDDVRCSREKEDKQEARKVAAAFQAIADLYSGRGGRDSALALERQPAPPIIVNFLDQRVNRRSADVEGVPTVIGFFSAAAEKSPAFLRTLKKLRYRRDADELRLAAADVSKQPEELERVIMDVAAQELAAISNNPRPGAPVRFAGSANDIADELKRWVGTAHADTVAAYRVVLMPQTVVIDHRGKVFNIYLGYTPGLADSLEEDLETIADLAEE